MSDANARGEQVIMRPTEPFRHEHQELLGHIEHLALAAREMPRLSEEERDALRTRILGFLRGTLVPHARAEEEVLYPEWAELVGFADGRCRWFTTTKRSLLGSRA